MGLTKTTKATKATKAIVPLANDKPYPPIPLSSYPFPPAPLSS